MRMRDRWFVLVVVLLCACAPQPTDGMGGACRLDHAELLLDAATEPPTAGAWEAVSLPDRWRDRRPEAGGLAWYRLEVPRPTEPNGIFALYLPHVNMNAAVWVNGAPIGSGGRLAEPVANDFNRPLYFPFPAALLDRPVNEIYVRLFAYEHHYGELDPVWIGPDEALRAGYEVAYASRILMSELATALCFAIVLFSTTLWLVSRFDPVYGWLAIVTALWGVVSFNYWLRDLPVQHWTWERIVHPAMDGFMLALAVWAHRYAGVHRPRLERLLLAMACLSLTVAWALPASHLYPAVNVVHAVVLPAVVYGTVLILRHARRVHPAEATVYMATGAIAIGFAIHDLALQFGNASPGAPFLLPSIVPLMLMAFGSTLVLRFASALRDTEVLNRELEQRVVDKHRELERSYDDRRTLEHSKLLAEERERLVRDMHDGLGGQLVSLLSLVEADGASDPRVAASVRTALADMRLVVDSLDPALHALDSALGAARARFEPLVLQNGMRLEWQATSLPRTPWLGPQDYLQVLRIVQEAIVNVVRHSRASRVRVRTGRRPDDAGQPGVFIEVQDDGGGLALSYADKPGSRGVRNMHERAVRLRGALRIESIEAEGLGGGTRVELWIPTSPPAGGVTRPA